MPIFSHGVMVVGSIAALIAPAIGMFESDNSARSSLTKPRNSVLLMPEIAGTKCAKVGTIRTAKAVKYQCQKSSKGLRWVMTSSKNTVNTSPTTTTTLAPIYLDAEITDASKLLATQECQIKDATFNSSDGSGTMSSGFPRPAQFPSSTGQLRVLVVPVNFNDLFFSSVDARAIEATYAKAN